MSIASRQIDSQDNMLVTLFDGSLIAIQPNFDPQVVVILSATEPAPDVWRFPPDEGGKTVWRILLPP